MKNDERIESFLAYYAGDYPVRDKTLSAYIDRLGGVDPATLDRALRGIESDAKITKTPTLAHIIHKIPGERGGGASPVPDNLTCPRSCRRGELVLQEATQHRTSKGTTYSYDFLAPCDCEAGKQAADLRPHQIASYLDGEDLRWRGLGDEQRKQVLDVAAYATKGIHPAEVRASPEQRQWLHEQGRGGPQSLVGASKRLAQALGARSIASERTADESAAVDAWSERADLR